MTILIRTHLFFQSFKSCCAFVLTGTNYNTVSIITSCLIIEAYFVSYTRLKTEVLRNCLVCKCISLCQTIDFYRPVSIQDIVHLLNIPASLCIRSMQLGQMDSVILYALDTTYNERINTLYIVLEILLKFYDITILIFGNILSIVLYHTYIIKICITVACGFCQCQSNFSTLRSCKVYIHVLEVTASVYGCTVIAVCISFYIVLCDRFFCIVCIKNVTICFYSHGSFAVTAVIYTYKYCIALSRFQTCQFLSHGNISAEFQHRVAVLALSNLCIAVACFCPVCFQRFHTTVEACICDMHAFAPCYINISFFAFTYDIRSLSLSL